MHPRVSHQIQEHRVDGNKPVGGFEPVCDQCREVEWRRGGECSQPDVDDPGPGVSALDTIGGIERV